MLISWPQCSRRRSSSNFLSNRRHFEYTGMFLFLWWIVSTTTTKIISKYSVPTTLLFLPKNQTNLKPTSNIISGWSYFCIDICFNCKNNLTTREEVSGENWSFGCSTKLFHKQFQEKKVEDFRKAVTYERNTYCLFTLRKRWRLKASVPSGNTPSTGFHRFPGK